MKRIVHKFAVAGAGLFALTGCDEALVSLQDAAAASALVDGETAPVQDADGARSGPRRGPPLSMDCSLPAFEERVLTSYDTDEDGALSTDEHEGLAADFEGDEPRGDGPPPDGGAPPDGAQDGPPPPPFGAHGHGRRMLEMLIWVYDTDGDEALSTDERAVLSDDLNARCEARQARLLADFDVDADGTLSDPELSAAQAALDEERQARFDEMKAEIDTDGDGAISQAEHEAAREAHKAAREAERARFDTDGDGTLSDTEELAVKEEIRAHIRNGDPPPMPPPPPMGAGPHPQD